MKPKKKIKSSKKEKKTFKPTKEQTQLIIDSYCEFLERFQKENKEIPFAFIFWQITDYNLVCLEDEDHAIKLIKARLSGSI